MIICYEGTPGSGKTYDAVRKISDNLRMKRKVYTNIDGMNTPECREALKFVSGLDDFEFNQRFHFLQPDQIKRFWDSCDEGSLIVIDEVHKWFNSRDWQTEGNRSFGDWASTHRHHGFDVILISQRIEKIDSQVRSLVEWTYRYRKINFLGALVQKGYVVFAYSGDDTTDVLSKQVRQYETRIFRCYKSYVGKDIKEVGIQKHTNILKHPVFLAIPIVLVITFFFAFRSGLAKGDLFGSKQFQEKYEGLKKNQPPVSQLQVISSNSPPTLPVSGSGAALRPRPEPAKPSIKPLLNPLAGPGQEKKLVAIVDGQKIYRCGASLCE